MRGYKFVKIITIIIGIIIFTRILIKNEKASYLRVIKYNNDSTSPIKVISNYENEIITIDLGKGGVNQIFGINQVLLKKKTNPIFMKKEYIKYGGNTDWIGPYVVRSKEGEINTNTKPKFTGGCHGTNGDSTGYPTAYTENIKIYIDGKESSNNYINLKGNTLEVVVTNYISGYNTQKYIIEEVVTYTIYENRIDINLESTALEDIVIERYYGLQAQNTKSSTIKYISFSNAVSSYDTNIDSSSSCGGEQKDSGERVYNIILTSYNKFELNMWIDLYAGLGKQEYIALNQPYAFLKNYGESSKIYYNLINGINFELEEGGSMFWRGGYYFNLK